MAGRIFTSVVRRSVVAATQQQSKRVLLSSSSSFTTNYNNTNNMNMMNNMLNNRRSFGTQAFLDEKEVTDRILAVIGNYDKIDSKKITPEAAFADLDLDSLDIVEVVMSIENEFALTIPDQEADKILTIPDAITYVSTHPMAK